MANNIEVKCNFTSVFAKYDTVEDLRTLANNICAQVKEAFDGRVAEIKAGTDVTVEVNVAKGEKTASKPAAKKSASSKAKEMAEKFKKQEKTVSKAKADGEAEKTVDISDPKAVKSLGLKFEKYNEKCWVLRGETKPLRKELKEKFKGVFNSRLTGGEGWVFRTANAQECANALGLKVKVA